MPVIAAFARAVLRTPYRLSVGWGWRGGAGELWVVPLDVSVCTKDDGDDDDADGW
jgi:hypothetical protein